MSLIHSIVTLVLLTIAAFLSLYNVNRPKTLIQQPKSGNVLITGASSGIGKQFAFWFGQQQKWRIFITGRNEEELNNVKNQILKMSDKNQVEIIKMDLNSDESVTQLVNKIHEITNNLDVVINCAGITHKIPDDLIELNQDEIEKMIQINVIAFTSLAKQISKTFFQPQKYGLFLQFSSGAGLLNQPMLSVYCASKNYQLSLIKCINEEIKAYNAHFVGICPLYVSTPMTMTSKTNWLFISPQTLVHEIVNNQLNQQVFIPHWSHKLIIKLLSLLPNSLGKNILYSNMITTRGKIINKLKKQQQINQQKDGEK